MAELVYAASSNLASHESSNLSDGTRKCSVCGVVQPVTAFAFKNKARGMRHARCRLCQKDYAQQHYKQNAESYRDRACVTTPQYIDRNQTYIRSLKEQHPCTDCGVRFPHYVMDFDHTHGTKVANVSVLARRGASLERISAEIDKCELVCANCHRARTWKRLQKETT